MELDFYDELDKQEQENENNEYWEQQYDELQIKYDCLMEAFKIQKDILTSKNKTINKAIEYIKHYGNLYCLKHTQFKNYTQYKEILYILKGEEQ